MWYYIDREKIYDIHFSCIIMSCIWRKISKWKWVIKSVDHSNSFLVIKCTFNWIWLYLLINCLCLTVTIITGFTIPVSNLNKIWTDIASTVVLLPLIIASCMYYQHKQLQAVGQFNFIRSTPKIFSNIVFRLWTLFWDS